MKLSVSNRLIASLPRQDRIRMEAHCEPVDLVFGQILCEPGEPYRHVYFPLTSFISLVTTISGHRPLEMGLIGYEGLLGATVALGVDSAPLQSIVQGAGSALRMSTTQLRRELRQSPRLEYTLKRYLYVLMAQLSQTAGCTRFHEVEPRLARWLLMTHDRAHADHFHLTQSFLAGMLGVRRAGITTAAGALHSRALINYSRGKITIVDRPGLERAACECYAAVVEDYRLGFA